MFEREFGFTDLVLVIFNEGAYLTARLIFHKAFNSFDFECEITLEAVPGTNQYLAMRVKCLAQGKKGAFHEVRTHEWQNSNQTC